MATTAAPELKWYAVSTLSRHEKKVEGLLRKLELETYLPLRIETRGYGKKVKSVELPALPGYLFVRCTLYPETRAQIKKTTGVLCIVENAGRPSVIPVEQIASFRRVLSSGIEVRKHNYAEGDMVEVARGPFEGVKGRFVRRAHGEHVLVLSIEFVAGEVEVQINPSDVEPYNP